MGTYGISTEEFMDGHIHTTKDKEGYYTFECFLRDFEGEVYAQTVAEAWNKLAEKYEWNEKLFVKQK